MATKPGMIPENTAWLLLHEGVTEMCISKQIALDVIEGRRGEGDKFQYILYSPDSLHEVEVRNKVVWERCS